MILAYEDELRRRNIRQDQIGAGTVQRAVFKAHCVKRGRGGWRHRFLRRHWKRANGENSADGNKSFHDNEAK